MERRGSEWNRWDLHIHTPNTKLHDNFEDSDGNKASESKNSKIWKEYCKKLNDSGIKCFGITDYFSVENYLFLNENRNNFGLDNSIILFPNIELRVAGLVSKSKNKGSHRHVNVHVIFPENSTQGELEKFLSNLRVEKSDGSELNFKDNLNEIIEKDQFSYVPTYKDMESALKKSLGEGYKSKTLIMIPNGDDGLSPNIGTAFEHNRGFMNKSVSIIQTTSKNDIDHYLNEVPKYYGRSIPCVSGTDAHDFKTFNNYPKEKSTWIKADLTFEGLKSIVYEPFYRVRIQANKPSTKVESKIISHVKLPAKEFNEQTVYFNDDMNVIIGGRSSGKSLLLSIIGKKAGYQEDIKGGNENYNKLIESKMDDTKLYYRNGNPVENIIIEYFYQDSLQQIARDRNLRNNFINETITNLNTINNIYKELDLNKSALNEGVTELLKNKKSLEMLHNDNKVLQEEEELEKNIEEIKTKINENTVTFTEDQKSYIQKFVKQIEEKKENISELDTKLEKIKEVQEVDIIGFSKNLSESSIVFLKRNFPTLEDELKTINSTYKNSIKKLEKELTIAKNGFTEEIEKVESDSLMEKYYESIEKTPSLKKLNDDLLAERNNLRKRQDNNSEIKSVTKKINRNVNEICELVKWENFVNSEEVLSSGKLVIKYETNVNQENLSRLFRKHLKTKTTNYKEITTGGFKNIINFDEEPVTLNSDDFLVTLKNIIGLMEKESFKSEYSLSTFLNEICKLNYIQQDYNITYEGVNFDTMSEGKKALILLLIKLEVGEKDCPLLIDQPEDNLDNRSIVEDIVGYFKKEKLKRQLFVVTHNANIVITGDSENVIIANEHDQQHPNPNKEKYYYKNGSLEGKVIKDEVCEILEGGVEAFRTRESRYNF